MRAALYNESRALRLANQADSRRSAACLPRGCDFGTEDRATESGALPRRAGRPRPAGRSIDADDGVPAAYLRPAGRRAPVVDDARDDDIVIIVRGGRRREAAAEQRVVYVDQGPSTRYDERYADDEDFVDAREPVPPRRWDLPRRDVAPPAFFPAPIRDDRKAVAWEVPTSTEQRARTAFGAGRRLARARGRPAEEPLPAPPPKALPPTPPTAQTPPDSSSSDDEPALNESDVFEATAGAIREVADLRAAAIDGSLTLKMTRAAVVDRLELGAGGDRLLKRTYKECMKAAMLEVAGALQLDQSPAVNDAMSQLGAILNVSERPAEAAAVDLALLDEIREERSEQPAVTVDLAADDESAPSSSTPSVTSASPPAYPEEPFSPAWADLTLAAPAVPVGLGPLPPDSALAARAAMPSSSSSSSDDDMPSLSSSVASPAPAAASPAGAPTSELTQCRTTPDPAGPLQFDATPTSAAAAELEHSPASVTTPSSTLSFATPVAGSPGRGTQTQRAATTSPVRGTQTETPRHAAATCGTQTPPPQVYVASPESVMRSVAAASARPRAVELEKSMRELDLLVGELERAATRASPATTASPMLSPPSDAQIEERLSSARRHRAEAVATKDTGL